MEDKPTEGSTGGLAAFISGLKEKPIETLVRAAATLSYSSMGVSSGLAERSAGAIVGVAKEIEASPSEALKKFTENVKKDPIGAILDTEAKWASVATGIPLPITEGVMEAVEDTVKGIIGLPSTIAEISKTVVTEVRENPIGVAKTYLYYAYNPKAKVEVTMAIGCAIRDSVINVRDEIANAATPDDKLRLISKLLTEIGICFIPVGGVVSKTGKMTVGAKSGSFMSNFIARLKPNWLGNRKPVMLMEKANGNQLKILSDLEKDLLNNLVNPEHPHNFTRHGNYGEIKVDVDLERRGDFVRKSVNRITDIDTPTRHGIDGIYQNLKPPPKWVVTDSKFLSANEALRINYSPSLSITSSGKQLSDKWTIERLECSVDDDIADAISKSIRANDKNVLKVVAKVDNSGAVTYYKVDSLGCVLKDINNNPIVWVP